MTSRKPPIYLLTGLLIGLALGVLYGWVLTPTGELETDPGQLRSDFKDSYRALIAQTYAWNRDLGRAESRLALLEDPDPLRALAVQAQMTLSEQNDRELAQALGLLAADLQAGVSSAAVAEPPSEAGGQPAAPTSTPTATSDGQASPTPTEEGDPDTTPTPTITPTLLPTSSPTPGAPFVLQDLVLECNPSIDPPRIMVYVSDSSGKPVPGVAAIVTWDGGTSRFVTGLKPSFGLGYADFDMDPALAYTLRLETGGDPIDSITSRQCTDGDEPYWGSWRFNFIQP